jgi:hypothetical protein
MAKTKSRVGTAASVSGWVARTLLLMTLPLGAAQGETMTLQGLEVSQAIQEMGHSVPLVADKPTVARAYLNGDAPVAAVSGVLEGRRKGGHWQTLQALNSVDVDPNQTELVPKRDDIAKSLIFRLPPAWLAAGALELRVSALTSNDAAMACANCATLIQSVSFREVPALRLRVLGLGYGAGSPATQREPTELDYELIASWLKRAFPISSLSMTSATISSTTPWPFPCETANAQIAAVRALDIGNGTDHRTHYHGLVRDGEEMMRGCASAAPDTPAPETVSSGPTGFGRYSWDRDGSYGDWYTGHELAHALGRKHPGSGCGESADDPNVPIRDGQISDDDGHYVGLDVGDPARNIRLAALPGLNWHDVMTYCDRQWLSAYTYSAILERLVAEGGSLTADGKRASDGSVVTGDLVSVVATVNLSRGTVVLASVARVGRGLANKAPDNSPASIRFVDARGQVLAEHRVVLRPSTDAAPGQDRMALIDAAVPLVPGVTQLQVILSGIVKASRPANLRPPTIRLNAPGPGAVLTWTAGHPDGLPLTFAVLVSVDDGRSWQTVAHGLTEPRYRLSRSDFQQSRSIQVRVLANDGFNTTVVTSPRSVVRE